MNRKFKEHIAFGVDPDALKLFDIILSKSAYSLRDIQRKKYSIYSEKKLEMELAKLLEAGLIKGSIYNFHVDLSLSEVYKPSPAQPRGSNIQTRRNKIFKRKLEMHPYRMKQNETGERKKRLRGE